MKKSNIPQLIIPAVIILLVSGCAEDIDPVPGIRVPAGDISADYWVQVDSVTSGKYIAGVGSTIYLSDGFELMRSADGAGTWETVLEPAEAITGIFVGDSQDSRVWVTTDQTIGYFSTGQGFNSLQTPDVFTAIVPHPELANHLFAISDTALYRSEDNGSHWTYIYSPPTDEYTLFTHLSVSHIDTSYLYILDDGGVRESYNSGVNFEPPTYPLNENAYTHLKTSPKGLWLGSSGFLRLYDLSTDDIPTTYGPILPASTLHDFLILDYETVLAAWFLTDSNYYKAYITRDANTNWADASPGLIGESGHLHLANITYQNEPTYIALAVGGTLTFLHKFTDTELRP